MVEKLLEGPKTYYLWLLFLLCVIAGCGIVYLDQLQNGLSVTGMSRDVSWGLYISQFTYFVGVAASAVMLVLPTYFHHYKKFKRMIIFGEFMAVAAVVMCALFIVVDLGQPQRMLNVMLHPTPNSVMFYDMLVLIGYLGLNIIIGWVTLEAERHEIDPPKWIKPLIYLSDSVGLSPSHTGDRLPVRWRSWPPLLAYCHHGWPLPGFRLLLRSCHPDAAHALAAPPHRL
jgi:Polysulphide reductase